MRSKIAVFVVLLALTAGVVGGGAVDEPSEVAHAWVDAYNDRDATRLCGLFVRYRAECRTNLRVAFAKRDRRAVRVAAVYRDTPDEAFFDVARAAGGSVLQTLRILRVNGRWLVDPAVTGPTAGRS